MTVQLALSDDEAEALAQLIVEHGRVAAKQRALHERTHLLTRDSAPEPPTTNNLVALVSVKLQLAQLRTQRNAQQSHDDAVALFSSCS